MSEKVLTFTDSDFEQAVVSHSTPTLVDFWADWCAPCKALSPVIEEVAEAYADKLQVGKMNIDEQPKTPGEFAVRALPTMLLFKNGAVVDQIVGLVTKSKIDAMLEKHL